jgi:L-iditol 2-dehydrogenase
MQALVYHGPNDLRVEARPSPEPGHGEAVLRVSACGICGTDLRIAAGAHRAYPPGTVRIPGHEVAGTILTGGDGIDLEEGQSAFIAPNFGCGRCAQCRAGRVNLCVWPEAIGISMDGGLADQLLLPANLVAQGNVLPVPETADLRTVALAEPLACVLRGSEACHIRVGDLVVIVGAGPVGLMHLLVAKLAEPSAVIVSQRSEERRRLALEYGADEAVGPDDLAETVMDVSEGRGADVVIVAAPAAAAQRQALEIAAPGARINFFGGLPRDRSIVELDTNSIHYKELVVTGTTANTTEDCRRALELVLGGSIDTAALISRSYDLAEADEGLAAAGSGEALKVVVEP